MMSGNKQMDSVSAFIFHIETLHFIECISEDFPLKVK